MTEITIRDIRREDAEVLAEIEQEAFSMPWSVADFRGLLELPYVTYIVAEVDGRVVGCTGFSDTCSEGNIDNVVVAKDYRNMGVGRTMLEELFRRGEEKGIVAYTLEVRVSNAPAIHLYEKMGFVSEGIRPGFYDKPKEDAMIMWKRQ